MIIDGYKSKKEIFSFLQDDPDILMVRKAMKLIEMLDVKEEHYIYLITRELVEKDLKKEWKYEENVEATHLYPVVTWYRKEGGNFM